MLDKNAHPPYWLIKLSQLLILIGILALVGMCAREAKADTWRSEDTYREVGFQALYLYDMQQNITALRQWQHGEVKFLSPYIVGNHYLGYQSNERAIAGYYAFTGLTHWLVSMMLPEPQRKVWQWVSIGYVGNEIYSNFQLGFRVSF